MTNKEKGITPVITAVLMLVLVISLASGAIYFLNTQQEKITTRLSEAVEEELEVESISCNGQDLSIYFSNEGNATIESGKAELLIYRGGRLDRNFSSRTVSLEGNYLKPGESGFLNVSMDGNFTSGTVYNVEMDILDSRTTFSNLCRAGQEWWDINWEYRRQIRVTGPNDGSIVTSVRLNTDSLMSQGKLQSNCDDLRIVKDQEALEESSYNVTDCGSSDARVYFIKGDSSQGTDFDTYIYYGNIRAEGITTTNSLTDVDREFSTEVGKEEKLDY